MSERSRVNKLERDVARLEDALYEIAHQRHPMHVWEKPRSAPLRTIWNRVQKRSRP